MMMSRPNDYRASWPVALVAGLLFLPLIGACGDDEEGLDQRVEDTFVAEDTDGPAPDTMAPPDDTTPVDTYQPPQGPNILAYGAGMFNAGGLPCVGYCNWNADAGMRFTLNVVYTDPTGAPLADKSIKWTIDASEDVAKITALSSFTDAQGKASVDLRSFGVAGTATITARANRDDDAGALEFVVVFELPAEPVLQLSAEYVGNESIADFELRLFKQTGGQPNCGMIHPDAGGAEITPDIILGPYGFGQQAMMLTLPELEQAGEQRWMAQYVGPTEAPSWLAVGCMDGIVVKSGETTRKLIYVLDLPPLFRGAYQSETRVDLVTGATGTVGAIVNGLADIFTDPGALILRWGCANASGTFGTVCNFLVNDNGDPTLVGGIITEAADVAFAILISNSLGNNVQISGQTISEMLRDVRLVNTLTLGVEPAMAGPAGFQGAYFGPGNADEVWTHVRFRWKHDPSCKNAADPLACGWITIPLVDIYRMEPWANLGAGVDFNFDLHVEPHTVPGLTYGPLINALMERHILPLIFGDGTGGTPAVDSWDDLFSVLLGDQYCLEYDDCCEYFTTRVEDDLPAWVVPFVPAACEAAIPAAANLVRNRLASLDGELFLGTPAGKGCPALDGNLDRWVDSYGSAGQLCEWDLSFPIGDSGFAPINNWRAVRAEAP